MGQTKRETRTEGPVAEGLELGIRMHGDLTVAGNGVICRVIMSL